MRSSFHCRAVDHVSVFAAEVEAPRTAFEPALASRCKSKRARRVAIPARQFGFTALSLMSLSMGPAAFAQNILKASPLGPAAHLLNRTVLQGWAVAVASATCGRVQVEVMPQAVAPPAGVLAAVRDGRADVSIMSNGAGDPALPLNALVEFAAQTPSAERASVAYQHVLTRFPALADEFAGVEVLSVFAHGPGAMLLAEGGAAAKGHWVGTKLHASASGAAGAVRALGAGVELAPGPAARQLLGDGKVKGTITAMETLDSFGLAPGIREISRMTGGFYGAGFSLVVNRQRWLALAADDRAAIISVSGLHLARLAGRAWDDADDAALRNARSRGVALVDAPDATVQLVKDASDAREAQWIDAMGVLSVAARNALAEYRNELMGARANAATGNGASP